MKYSVVWWLLRRMFLSDSRESHALVKYNKMLLIIIYVRYFVQASQLPSTIISLLKALMACEIFCYSRPDIEIY